MTIERSARLNIKSETIHACFYRISSKLQVFLRRLCRNQGNFYSDNRT